MNTDTMPNAHLLTPCGTNYAVPISEPHTPGPWKAVKNEAKRGFDIWGQHTSEQVFLAEVVGDLVVGPENRANARLIAAAPDMLAALELVDRAWSGDGVEMSAAVDACLMAIAKSKGEVLS